MDEQQQLFRTGELPVDNLGLEIDSRVIEVTVTPPPHPPTHRPGQHEKIIIKI